MKEYPKEWLLALRSGKYKQGIGQLRYGDFYCCLGVLCDITDKKWFDDSYDDKKCVLPQSIMDRYGLEFDLPRLSIEELKDRRGMSLYIELSRLNDDGFTFDQIADVIEYFWREIK